MHHLTKCSLFLEFFLFESSPQPIAVGTGFTIQVINGTNYLITNWHNVTGKNAETGNSLSKNGHTDPEFMIVHFLKKDRINEWVKKKVYLIDENFNKLYLEHPRGKEIDVVAIKLPVYDDVDIHNCFDALTQQQFTKQVSDSCSIVGFPKGISTAGKLPIWKTGNIASELEIDHDERPMFLIDASTREGMSGSPVYCISKGETTFGDIVTMGHGTPTINFLGVYSGRIGTDIEIGRVFKESCIIEILRHHSHHPITQNRITSYTYIQR
ncbi:serine protease [Chryseobacterium phosphatilyticum]|uniref:Serine protease n=1 Tax=Chryseobacterium phosphatilyticum TaxID=475075 RepID=A0A316XGT0_9FLAO|nr:trypsin-like peptidase domain-containing protein [Chryseobacterium phosphatilyticum]PWN71956.1 serine protease [Chryseobacterium phosphatilyticum]